MKPRSKIEREALSLHDKYSRLTPAVIEWVRSHKPSGVKSPYASIKGDKRWCPVCGKTFDSDKAGGEKVECPHCGALLELERPTPVYTYEGSCKGVRRTQTKRFLHTEYYEQLCVCRGWQVDRIIYCDWECVKGHPAKAVSIFTPYEIWFNPVRGKRVILSQSTVPFAGWRRCPWSWCDKSFSVKRPSEFYEDWIISDVYPRRNILPYFKERGFCSFDRRSTYITYNNRTRFYTIDSAKVLNALLEKEGRVEKLIKMGESGLARLLIDGSPSEKKRISEHWDSLMIAHRHRYEAENIRDYLDYLGQLKALGRDLRNPFYICPEDFGEAHTRATEALQRMREKEARERRLRESREHDETYIKAHKKWLGLSLRSAHLTYRTIQSAIELSKEGEAMHHCVGGYWNKDDSLILTARNAVTDERVETVEIDLRKWTIIQSRAVCNGTSEYHDEILAFLNLSMDSIKAFGKASKKNMNKPIAVPA